MPLLSLENVTIRETLKRWKLQWPWASLCRPRSLEFTTWRDICDSSSSFCLCRCPGAPETLRAWGAFYLRAVKSWPGADGKPLP